MASFLGTAIAVLLLALTADLNLLEVGGAIAAAALASAYPRFGFAWFRKCERAASRVSRRRGLSILLAALLAPALRIAMLPVLPVPEPKITDEYSHLLLADTLAHGRLTNPTHPMWVHFEAIHIIQRPTYNSMYFPGQGAFLALGRVVAGTPWAGVVLMVALMSGAICWMLQAWVPPPWALGGAVLASLRMGLFSYWMNSYWGGALAALGGALVLGAWPRVERRMRLHYALLMGAGIVVLAASRPYEGLFLCVPVAVSLLRRLVRLHPTARARALGRVAAPILIVAAAGAALLCLYSQRITGHPFRLPYQVNQSAYGWPLTLAWQVPAGVSHRHEDMRRYFEWELGEHVRLLSPAQMPFANISDFVRIWSFYFGVALALPLVLFPRAFLDRRIRPLLIAAGCVLVAVLLEQSRYPHYFSPAAAAVVALWVQGLRHVRAAGRRKPAMLTFSRLIPAIVLLAIAGRAVAGDAAVRYGQSGYYVSSCCGGPGDVDRARIIRNLQATDDKHLVIVRYKLSHPWMDSWIYNAADIDNAKIVWARDLGAADNRRLLDYFRNRKVWVLNADERPLALSRYVPAPGGAAAADRFPPYRPALR